MQNRYPCKGCSADVHVTPEQIDRMVDKLARFPDACVEDREYESRLAACAVCSSLRYGTTCSHCGCFVRVRAKLRSNSCPSPGGSRWMAEA